MQRVSRYPARTLLALVACGMFFSLTAAAFAANAPGRPPRIRAASAVLIEAETGKVLYASHPDLPYAPASLAKLMTLQLALNAIEAGKIALDQEIVPVKPAWDVSMPPGSSLMFLGPNQRLSVKTLLTGLVVDSGNDAAYEIAYLVAGSVPSFVRMMNNEARSMGFPDMHFVGPSGISSRNRITALEYAEFCRDFIRLHPRTLKTIFTVKRFSYPNAQNLTNGTTGHPIVQYNRNLLLWDYPGTDGLKTGYIDQAGYNMAVTATRHGMRLIGVVLGVHHDARYDGEQLRAIYEERLLNYGFDNFVKLEPTYPALLPVHVWKGAESSVRIGPYRRAVIVLPKGETQELHVRVVQRHNVLAPVIAGDTLGRLVFTVGGKRVREIPLVAENNVGRGGFASRLVDSLVLFARGVIGLPGASAASPPPRASLTATRPVPAS